MGQSPPAPHEALRAGEERPARLPPPFLPPQPPPTALRLARSPGDVTRDGGFAPNKRDADLPPGLGLENFFFSPLLVSFAVVKLFGGGLGVGMGNDCKVR